MSNQTSSAVVLSGYLPIEITDGDFQKTVEKSEDSNSSNSERKKRTTPHKSMTQRIGGLLSPSRKKKDAVSEDDDIDRNSLSGLSNAGQQSIASKTVDSGTTIKASNLHQEQSQTTALPVTSMLMNTNSVKANAPEASLVGKTQQTAHTSNNSKNMRPPKPWKNPLKRLVGKGRHNKQQSASLTSQSCSDLDFAEPVVQRLHAKSHDETESFSLNNGYPMRKRFYSEGVDSIPQQPRFKTMSFSGRSPRTNISQHAIDQIIRGRLDGIDVLSLGPARGASLPASSQEANTHDDPTQEDSNRSDNDDSGDECLFFDPLHISFTNSNPPTSPAKLIDEMIWTSAGIEQPEIILEGFYPGGSDRWGVRLAALPTLSSKKDQTTKTNSRSSNDCNDSSGSFSASNSKPGGRNDGDESTASNTTDNDGGTNLPVAELWDSLWGTVSTPPPIPSHMNMQTLAAIRTASPNSTPIDSDEEDQLFSDDDDQKYAAMCNVPIDIDDDAFMIDSPHHVALIHEIAMVPLQALRFDSAISLLEKLLRGLDGNEKYTHLHASTNHNIGMIQLCQGKYQKALESFRKAVELRKECLPADHPDIAVSLEREGMAHFALESVLDALKCFEAALEICTSLDNARAKILNNIGVVRYHLGDYVQAQKSFTSALEIQRPWLEGPVRRPSIVNIASTILSNMGRVYLREGDYDLAYFVFEEACLMQTSIFRKDHDAVLNSLDNMGRAHAKKENFFEALRIFTSLHRSQEARFGPNSEACIETLGMMGVAHFRLLDYEDAEKCLTKVANWQSNIGKMDESHRSVKTTTEHIKQIKRCLQGKEPMWV